MESNTFINSNIYIHFRNEYFSNKKNPWDNFIESKDLGVICISYLKDEYRITDEKKWLINKIKYGF